MYPSRRKTSNDEVGPGVGGRLGAKSLRTGYAGIRPNALQFIVNEAFIKMLADDVALMPQRLAGKVFGKVLKPGRLATRSHALQPSLQNHFDECTEALWRRRDYRELATGLRQVCSQLVWTKASSGAFASINFENSNSHSVIIGPNGLEEWEDARIGITMLAPYARMPDHCIPCPRTYLALSDAEFSTEDRGWVRTAPGTVCFSAADETAAYRSTAAPLLMIWCDVPSASRFTTRK
jgi:hypothetical protein